MLFKSFDITLDNSEGVYYAGQKISGRVNLTVDSKNKKVKGVILTLKGEAKVKWTAYGQRIDNAETYFENKTVLFGEDDNKILESGQQYSFQFDYDLPSNIPSSFESKFGYIRYTAQAIIERPWKSNHETKTIFTVICPEDLNQDQKLVEPIRESDEKTFCCLCCTSLPLSATISLKAGGFVPGENLLANIEIENASRINISNISVLFEKVTIYNSNKKTKIHAVEIIKKELGALNKNTNQNWENVSLSIPSLPSSGLKHCNIIDLCYKTKLIICPSGCFDPLILNIPVKLGTIPLLKRFVDLIPSTVVSQTPNGWNYNYTNPSSEEFLPPPAFVPEESLKEKKNSYEITYTPRYPVYSFRS